METEERAIVGLTRNRGMSKEGRVDAIPNSRGAYDSGFGARVRVRTIVFAFGPITFFYSQQQQKQQSQQKPTTTTTTTTTATTTTTTTT